MTRGIWAAFAARFPTIQVYPNFAIDAGLILPVGGVLLAR